MVQHIKNLRLAAENPSQTILENIELYTKYQKIIGEYFSHDSKEEIVVKCLLESMKDDSFITLLGYFKYLNFEVRINFK